MSAAVSGGWGWGLPVRPQVPSATGSRAWLSALMLLMKLSKTVPMAQPMGPMGRRCPGGPARPVLRCLV